MRNDRMASGSSAVSVALEARGLSAGYGDLAAVRDLDLALHTGEIIAIFGPNGAGKTTTLLTLAGALPPLKGDVLWRGQRTTRPLHRRVRDGMGFVPEERSVVSSLSTLDNLRLGLGTVEDALRLFPQLEPLLNRPAGLLSGGEQQMLTLGRALALLPAALLVDELSLGLAPVVVEHLLDTLRANGRPTRYGGARSGATGTPCHAHRRQAAPVPSGCRDRIRGCVERASTPWRPPTWPGLSNQRVAQNKGTSKLGDEFDVHGCCPSWR